MFCSKCGGQMPQGSAFCTSCGTSFAEQPQQATSTPSPTPQPQGDAVAPPVTPVPVKKAPDKKKLMVMGGAALAVIAIAITLIFVLGGNRIVGTWQYAGSEELLNGRVDWSRQAGQWDDWQVVFNRNGTGAWVEGTWSDSFRWSTSGSRLTITDDWGGRTEHLEFSVSRNELRIIERWDDWDWWTGEPERWEYHQIFRRR